MCQSRIFRNIISIKHFSGATEYWSVLKHKTSVSHCGGQEDIPVGKPPHRGRGDNSRQHVIREKLSVKGKANTTGSEMTRQPSLIQKQERKRARKEERNIRGERNTGQIMLQYTETPLVKKKKKNQRINLTTATLFPPVCEMTCKALHPPKSARPKLMNHWFNLCPY